jgi:hypothetical protein
MCFDSNDAAGDTRPKSDRVLQHLVMKAEPAWAQCRLLQRGRQMSPDEFVILVVRLVLYGE